MPRVKERNETYVSLDEMWNDEDFVKNLNYLCFQKGGTEFGEELLGQLSLSFSRNPNVVPKRRGQRTFIRTAASRALSKLLGRKRRTETIREHLSQDARSPEDSLVNPNLETLQLGDAESMLYSVFPDAPRERYAIWREVFGCATQEQIARELGICRTTLFRLRRDAYRELRSAPQIIAEAKQLFGHNWLQKRK